MALSGVVSKSLVGRSLGNPFSRSSSFEDLSSAPVPRDAIQAYLSAPGRPIRMLASDAISAVNLKLRNQPRGFYSKNQCIVPGSSSTDDLYIGNVTPDSMRFVLGLADILFVSVSTFSGKEYVFSVEPRTQPSVRDLKCRLLENESSDQTADECQLVPVSGGSPLKDDASLWQVGLLGKRHLHLVAHRSSKVHFRAGDKGRGLELSIHAAPVFAKEEELQKETSSFLEDARADPLALPANELTQQSGPEARLLEEVQEGLNAGFAPQLTEEGSGGTYFMSNSEGNRVAVFKPMDEEPLAVNCPRGMTPSATGEGLKAGTRVGEGAYREVAAFLLDHSAENDKTSSSEDRSGFSGVPLTVLARCSEEFFLKAASQGTDRWSIDGVPALKQGSLQQFVPAVSNCEDMGPKHFPSREVHKIAVLDMRLGNTDRNGANILVQKTASGLSLVPIDHGYCLPETLEECTFEWLYWPQAKEAFDADTLTYIKSLDAEADIGLLKNCGWDMSHGAARTLRACTLLLQKGAAAGLTPFAIGSLMVRTDPFLPCALEEMAEEAEASLDCQGLNADCFSHVLADVIDQHLGATTH